MDEGLDLKLLLTVLKKYIILIAVCAVIAGAAGFCTAAFLIPERYESSAMLYVENTQNSGESLNINDITAAQKLVNTCQILFQSNSMKSNIIFELDLPYTEEELGEMITVTAVNSTEVMRITAVSNDPKEAADIVNVLVELAQEEFHRIIKSGSIEVVEYGIVEDDPSFPSKTLFAAAGLFIGAVVCYICVFVRELLDVTVKPDDDLSKLYEIPVFARIMDFESRAKGEYGKYGRYDRYGGYSARKKNENTDEKQSEAAGGVRKRYVLDENTSFVIAEAYKTARTNMIFSLSAAENNVVSFTSAEAGEGKSTTSANIAISFADMGKRVLLIDADMRKPTVQETFSVTAQNGLSSVLGGFCEADEAIIKNVRTSLDILTSGPIPPNPTELLGSKNMQRLIEQVSKKYDYVMLDTPPINIVTDSQLTNSVIGGHVFVVRENSTAHPDIQSALEKVKLANGKILGMIEVFCGSGEKQSKRYGKKKGYYSYNRYESYSKYAPDAK